LNFSCLVQTGLLILEQIKYLDPLGMCYIAKSVQFLL
jgi:hypothetical protein